MWGQNKCTRNFYKYLLVAFPIILISAGILGVMITLFLLGRSDLTIRSLILTVPLILSGLFLFKNNIVSSKERSSTVGNKVNFFYLVLFFVILIIWSIIVLIIYESRPYLYFIIISLISGIIIVQILNLNSVMKQRIVLLEILLTSLCIIWGVTLKYPLFFAGTDTLQHLYLINTIIDSGNTSGLRIDYTNFPLFHILIAVGYEISGLTLRTTLFVVMGLVWQVGTLAIYVLTKSLTKSCRISLIACLLFALSLPVIYYGLYPITRSLALISFLFILYFIFKQKTKDKIKDYALLFLFFWTLILTHHVTAMFIVPIVVTLFCIKIIIGKRIHDDNFSSSFILLYCVSLISYLFWVAYSFTKSSLNSMIGQFVSNDAATVIGEIVSDNGYIFLIERSYFAFALFLSLIGVGYILYVKKNKKNTHYDKVIALTCSVFLIVFIPGPLDLFSFSDILLGNRFALLVAPFITIGMAYGVEYLVQLNDHATHSRGVAHSMTVFIVACLIMTMTFLSLTSGNNGQDSSDLEHANDITPYFTKADMVSFTYISTNANDSMPLYSDYYVVRDAYHLNQFETKRVIKGGNISYIESGYLLLRIGELDRTGVLTFSPFESTSTIYKYNLSEQSLGSNIVYQSYYSSRIYSDGQVSTFIMND